MGLLSNANRQSGDWLPGVEKCPARAKPCGNPSCADEAMHAKEMDKGSVVGQIAAKHAAGHAQKIAAQCGVEQCPLEGATGQSRGKVIKLLQGGE